MVSISTLMINLTLKQMRYFDALARQGHFGRAADACAISQPALSMQIQEMERTLGTPLLERGARGVSLTPFGEDVLARLREVLRIVGEIEDTARAARDRLAGRIRIGRDPNRRALCPAPDRGGVAAPLPRSRPATARDADLPPDRGIGRGQSRRRDPRAARGRNRIRGGTAVSPKPSFSSARARTGACRCPAPNAARNALLLLEEGHCFRDQALSFCNMTTSAPREMMDGSSLSTLVQMVGAGLGVTLIPEMAVDIETRSADVSVDGFDAPGPERTIGMIWRRSNPLSRTIAGDERHCPRGGNRPA
jgi:LysR family hydrogen peroxide-inducible transcriptional activator